MLQVVFWDAVWLDLRETAGCFGVLVGVLFRVTVQAHSCEIDGRAQGGMRFGVLVQVLCWDAAWGPVGGC